MVDPVTTSTVFWDLKASEIMKFFSALVTALAWPLSAFFIVNLFKNEIIERIPKLSELTLPGGISAKFNKDLEKIATAVTRIPDALPAGPENERAGETAPASSAVESKQSVSEQAVQTAVDRAEVHANPNGIVMAAWVNLELALRDLGASGTNRVVFMRRDGPSILIESMRAANKISDVELQLIKKLLELRDLAAHAKEKISEADALRFKEIADSLAASYRDAASAAAKLTQSSIAATPAG